MIVGGGSRDLRQREATLGLGLVPGLQRRAADQGLDAAVLAAVALGAIGGEHVVAPLAGNAVMTVENAAVDDDAGADPGAHDDAEHHFRIGMVLAHRTKMGFCQREAVGIVGDQHRHTQLALQILLERLAVELGGVAVLHQAGLRIPRPRRAHADDGRALANLLGALSYQLGDLADHVLITARPLGGDAVAQQHLVAIQHHAFTLGTAKIDTPIQ